MLIAERLQSDESNSKVENIGVVAELTQDFTLVRYDGLEITLCEGTQIHIDEVKGIASFKDLYFSVLPNDYRITYPN